MLEQFQQWLHQRIGMDIESVGHSALERAIKQRQRAAGAADSAAYWQLLQGSSREQQALIEAIVVPETWFFRYPESFAVLGCLAQERLASLAGSRPLRIISLPCSTGEEPYSIVMALLDAGIDKARFSVDAFDISERVVQHAKAGVYGRNAFRGDYLKFQRRYFSARGDAFELNAEVRDKVNFSCANLLAAPVLATQPRYDMVFCRNLLIYFDRPTQEQALKVLKGLLDENGSLFTGPAEAGLMSSNGLRALGVPLSFVFQRDQRPARPALNYRPPVIPVPVAPPISRQPVARPAVSKKPALNNIEPAKSPSPTANQSDAAALELSNIEQLANSGRSDEARAACERLLAERGGSAGVFYWLGLLSDGAGQADAAQNYYRKVLYIDPHHREALAQLALLLAAKGDLAGARRLQERASRGVKQDG